MGGWGCLCWSALVVVWHPAAGGRPAAADVVRWWCGGAVVPECSETCVNWRWLR